MFGFLGAMIGGINGGLLYSRMTNLTFRECNDATVFESHGVAQRKMLDTMTLSFSRGAVRFGIRYGIFCFAFSYVIFFESFKYSDIIAQDQFNCFRFLLFPVDLPQYYRDIVAKMAFWSFHLVDWSPVHCINSHSAQKE